MQSLEMRGSTVNEKSSGLHSCYVFSNSGQFWGSSPGNFFKLSCKSADLFTF